MLPAGCAACGRMPHGAVAEWPPIPGRPQSPGRAVGLAIGFSTCSRIAFCFLSRRCCCAAPANAARRRMRCFPSPSPCANIRAASKSIRRCRCGSTPPIRWRSRWPTTCSRRRSSVCARRANATRPRTTCTSSSRRAIRCPNLPKGTCWPSGRPASRSVRTVRRGSSTDCRRCCSCMRSTATASRRRRSPTIRALPGAACIWTSRATSSMRSSSRSSCA